MLEGSILYHLNQAHQLGQEGKRPLNFGVYYKNTLVALCHALEDCILTGSSQPLVITAFQRGKWYLQEADRYGELAQKSQQVVIMATPDGGFQDHPTSQRANVEVVPLTETDPVAQEWNLLILAPTYTAMVLCQELSEADYGPQGLPSEDRERKFYGFWTFERELVTESVNLSIAHLRSMNPDLADRLHAQVAEIAAQAETADRDEIYTAVSLVVEYLQTGQHDLQQPGAPLVRAPEALDNNLLSNELQALLRLAQLIDQSDLRNSNAAAEVACLAEAMAQLLDLPAWQLNRLRLAGLLHRLAFLQRSDSVLNASGGRARHAATEPHPTCPIVPGSQILRVMQRLSAIATIITHQTEYWNGQGQPAGLQGDEIPLESRILGLLIEFQQRVADAKSTPEAAPGDFTTAWSACQAAAGDRWDPKLVEGLGLLVSALSQGMTLPVQVPKIAAGMWLLDSHAGEEMLNPATSHPVAVSE